MVNRPAPRTAAVALAAAGLAACAALRPSRPAEPAFDAARAGAEVAWLADPVRTGRGMGTPGNAAAAAWLAERFGEAGLAPAGTEGFLQPFEAPFRATLEPGNALALGATTPVVGAGFQPFTFSDDGEAEGELVFAGYGVTAADLAYDDYAGLDVKGKVVLVAADFPRETDPASPFRDPKNYRYGEWRYKAMNARDHGAKALVAVRDDWHHPGKDELPPWKGIVSARAGLPAVQATAAALAAAGVDVAALARAIGESGKPASKALGVPVKLRVAVTHERARTANVVGLLAGRDPAKAAECVVVGAHYDGLGVGGESSLAPGAVGTVHPGADDNASGVAALLAVARAFAAAGPPARPVLFVAFAAEELGVLGSSQLVKSPPPACAVEKMQLMLNLDMVGRPKKGRLYVEGVDTGKGLRERLPALRAAEPAIPLELAPGGDGYGASDHTPFYAKGVPVLFFFTGAHDDYHRPSDTAEKVDPRAVVDVARLAFRAARDAGDRPERYEVVQVVARPSARGDRGGGGGAFLGTIPDFAERSEPGVLLTGARAGSPAAAAGLAAGDVVVRLGPTTVRTLADLGYALKAFRPGDEVEVEWLRGGVRMTAKVKLAEKK